MLAALAEPVEVVTDPDPSGKPDPWRNYRHALETAPAGATHRLILQDDVVPCTGLLRAARAAVEARPDRLLAFFVSGAAKVATIEMYRAADKGHSWIILPYAAWCPTVCLCWPVSLIDVFLEFVARQNPRTIGRADDEITGRFLKQSRIQALASVPSLVEHPDTTPSLIGKRARGGIDSGRLAACWIGDCDPASIDWTLGPS